MRLFSWIFRPFRRRTYIYETHSIPAKEIEKWVRKVAKKSGCDVDWHYFGGRAMIYVFGNNKRVFKADKAIDELGHELNELRNQAWPVPEAG